MLRSMVFLGIAGVAYADPLPKPPTAFETRNTGTSGEVSNEVSEDRKPAVKVTYVAVCESRDWKNSDGRTIQASLIAWEQGGEAQGRLDLTLVNDGKVRLLLPTRKVAEYPLSQLSEGDRKFVDGLVLARRQAAEKARETPEAQR